MQKSFLVLLVFMSSGIHAPQAKPLDPITFGLGVAALGTIGGLGKYYWDVSNAAKATYTLTEAKEYLGTLKKQYNQELGLLEKGGSQYDLVHFIGASIPHISSSYVYNVASVVKQLEAHESALRQQWSNFSDQERVEASQLSNALGIAKDYVKTLQRTLDSGSHFWPLCDIKNNVKNDDLMIQLERTNIDHAIRVQFAHEVHPYLAAYRALERERSSVHKALRDFQNGVSVGVGISPFHHQVYQEVAQRAGIIDTKYAFVIGNPQFQHEKEQSQHDTHMAQLLTIKQSKARAKEALAAAAQKQVDEERRANDLRRQALYEERRKNDYNAEVARQGRIFDAERDILKQRVADEQWRNQELQKQVCNLQGQKAKLEYKLAEQAHLHSINQYNL